VSAPATTVSSETAVTTAAAATSTPAPADAVPEELAGTWKVDEGQGVTNRLTLRGNSYSWSFGAGGRVSVDGDVIEFSDAIDQAACPGSGSYRWQIEGDILTFTLLGPPDDCSVRQSHFGASKEYYR
jgi:hypothetical protein